MQQDLAIFMYQARCNREGESQQLYPCLDEQQILEQA